MPLGNFFMRRVTNINTLLGNLLLTYRFKAAIGVNETNLVQVPLVIDISFLSF